MSSPGFVVHHTGGDATWAFALRDAGWQHVVCVEPDPQVAVRLLLAGLPVREAELSPSEARCLRGHLALLWIASGSAGHHELAFGIRVLMAVDAFAPTWVVLSRPVQASGVEPGIDALAAELGTRRKFVDTVVIGDARVTWAGPIRLPPPEGPPRAAELTARLARAHSAWTASALVPVAASS